MKEHSIFFEEWLATDRNPAQLPISATCNGRCLFCSNDLNPFRIARPRYRDLEDIKLQLHCMPAQYADAIMMSDSLPGRISEGEAFLHPELWAVLDAVRRRFPFNRLCFTTNGSMLDEAFIRALARYRPVEVTLSLHALQPDLWGRIFHLPADDATRALEAPARLRAHGIALVGTIVPMPALCGWEEIERTYEVLVAAGAQTMVLYWPGHTVRTPPDRLAALQCPLAEFEAFVARVRTRHPGVTLLAHPDLRAPLGVPVRRIMAHTLHGNVKAGGGAFRHALWLASEGAAARLSAEVAARQSAVPNRHTVIPVPNRSYGGNILSAGLLLADDFIGAGRDALTRHPEADLILLPAIPFDAFQRDLQKVPAYRIAEALQRHTRLVAPDGAHVSLGAREFLKTAPPSFEAAADVMRQFNRVWEPDGDLEAALSYAHPFPWPTSAGWLERDAARAWLAQERARRRLGSAPAEQRFERLDEQQVWCLEQWWDRDMETLRKQWTLLAKRGADWRIAALWCAMEP